MTPSKQTKPSKAIVPTKKIKQENTVPETPEQNGVAEPLLRLLEVFFLNKST